MSPLLWKNMLFDTFSLCPESSLCAPKFFILGAHVLLGGKTFASSPAIGPNLLHTVVNSVFKKTKSFVW